jgi:2-polyprenyl-3-methyl-5-hydroxy-6-metoxy-1,4-benzoquinol methylase
MVVRLGEGQLLCQLMQSYIQDDKWEALAELLLRILEIDPFLIASVEVSRIALEVFEKTDLNAQAVFVLRESMSRVSTSTPTFQSMAILREVERVLTGRRSYGADISSEYYDDIYAFSPKYKLTAVESPYLPVWAGVVGMIKQKGFQCILDLGCGPGQFAAYLIDQFPEIQYTGIDFSSVAIEEAKKRCPAACFQLANLHSIDAIIESKFDVVLIMEVLEHIQNDLAILTKLPSKINVIASVPNFDSYAHVRFFRNAEEVRARYGNVMSNLVVLQIFIKKSVLFVMTGMIR